MIKIKLWYGEELLVNENEELLILKILRNNYYKKQSKFRRKTEESYIYTKNIGKNNYKFIEGIIKKTKTKEINKKDFVIFPINNIIIDI